MRRVVYEYCGMSACPKDAVEVIKKSVSYVCEKKAGRGAVREFIDKKILQYEYF